MIELKNVREARPEERTTERSLTGQHRITILMDPPGEQVSCLEPSKELVSDEASKGLTEKDAPEELADFGRTLEGADESLLKRPLKLARANNPESYWRPQILEAVAAEQWCNGKDRQIRAGLKQVTLIQRRDQEQLSVRIDCDMPSYMDLLRWLVRFRDQLATPQK